MSVADPDRVTRFLEPSQNFQIWMKMDKNLIFCDVCLTQNPVKILSRSTTACKQTQLLREMSMPCFVDLRQLRTGLGWIMVGCCATQVNKILKNFLRCFVCCGEAVEIGETEFASRRFLLQEFVGVRYKKLSINQTRGITWLSQGGGAKILCRCSKPKFSLTAQKHTNFSVYSRTAHQICSQCGHSNRPATGMQYPNPKQDVLDLKSSMCRKVSNVAKTILGVNVTGKELFESISSLSAPAPPRPFTFTSTKVNSGSKTIAKPSTSKSTSPPKTSTKAVPKQPKSTN